MAKSYLITIYWIWAKVYDKFIDSLFKFDRKKVIKALQIKKKEKILEVGVGTGLNLPYYPASCNVTGIDFSSAMLQKAKEKQSFAEVDLQISDARKLPFPKDSFNKALATYVLRVSPEPHKIMEEVSKVVKKNGLFVIVDQFKGENKLFLFLVQPFKLLLGWGKEHFLKDLLTNTPWVIVQNKQIGIMKNTKIIVLKNRK